MMTIEQNLREICKRKGLKLSDVAERMGTGQSNLITSIKGNPTLSKLVDVAAALQVDVSELITLRPVKSQGIAFIDGKTYQLTRPAASTVQLPSFDRYDTLREEIKDFVKKSIESGQNSSMMGLLESFEVFSLLYDAHDPCFFVSLCYADGQTMTFSYHRLEYANWKEEDTEETLEWDTPYVIEEIINDIEGAVPTKLQEL